MFTYNLETNQIINVDSKNCLEAEIEDRRLKFSSCNDSRENQKWTWSCFTNFTMLQNWKQSGSDF